MLNVKLFWYNLQLELDRDNIVVYKYIYMYVCINTDSNLFFICVILCDGKKYERKRENIIMKMIKMHK